MNRRDHLGLLSVAFAILEGLAVCAMLAGHREWATEALAIGCYPAAAICAILARR